MLLADRTPGTLHPAMLQPVCTGQPRHVPRAGLAGRAARGSLSGRGLSARAAFGGVPGVGLSHVCWSCEPCTKVQSSFCLSACVGCMSCIH